MLVHFTLVFISSNPFLYSGKTKPEYYAQWYTYPYFSQNWNLFVPPPNTNYKLFVEYKVGGETQRKDLFSELVLKHQANRLKGYGPLVLAFTNSIHYFEKNTEGKKALNGPVTTDLYFKMLEKSTLNYLRATHDAPIDTVKIRLVVHTIGDTSDRVYFN